MKYRKGTCPYCGGPAKCKECGRTCADSGGLTDEALCAGCAVQTTLKYDYDIQAWCRFIDGEWWIEPCNHPPEMDCKCTGRVYGGYRLEDVPRKHLGTFEKDTGNTVDVYVDGNGLLTI